MTRFVSLQLGKIIQYSGLQASNPLQSVVWYSYNGETIDEAGMTTQTYTQTTLKARVQPTSKDAIFKYNLEFGNVYKTFFVLTDTIQVVNRNISTDGDFIQYNDGINNLYYRVLKVPNEFLTQWQEIIGMQTNVLGV